MFGWPREEKGREGELCRDPTIELHQRIVRTEPLCRALTGSLEGGGYFASLNGGDTLHRGKQGEN